MATQYILQVSDLHCGHKFGLTPPGWHGLTKSKRGDAIVRRQWKWYREIVAEALALTGRKEFDGCFLLADLIDGRQEKQGGQELVETAQYQQAQMAIKCLQEIPARRFTGVYGTPYHSGKYENFEDIIADALGCTFHNRHVVDINGTLFDLKHKVGNTSTPTGGDIALRKVALQAREWHLDHSMPLPHIYLRGHVHRLRAVSDLTWTVVTSPALQLWTEFGSRQCEGLIHFGVVLWTVPENGQASFLALTRPLNIVAKQPQPEVWE